MSKRISEVKLFSNRDGYLQQIIFIYEDGGQQKVPEDVDGVREITSQSIPVNSYILGAVYLNDHFEMTLGDHCFYDVVDKVSSKIGRP